MFSIEIYNYENIFQYYTHIITVSFSDIKTITRTGIPELRCPASGCLGAYYRQQ